MHIKSFEVDGLFGRDDNVTLQFNSDMNIITGRNGSGKTTVLKLIWYILSGNIIHALQEVVFKKATLETTEYTCMVYRLSRNTCRVTWLKDGKEETFEDISDDDGGVVLNAEDQANSLLIEHGSSIFLPTFRRIEGGFTLDDNRQNMSMRGRGSVEEALVVLSKRLSNGGHVFVASLGTIDIVSLIVKQYTDLSEEYNKLQQKTSQDIITKIKEFKSYKTKDELGVATKTLDEIRQQIESMEESREEIMRPLEAVRELAKRLLKHAGIKLGKSLSLGDAAGAINSDALSAGEKQMLSFIAYNAFYRDSIFIIDEPELSLHVDWQRQLFPTLMAQQATNQFLIATHSPFIYTKYPDKEIQIDLDRGDVEE